MEFPALYPSGYYKSQDCSPSEKLSVILAFLYLVNLCQENELSQENMLNYKLNITYICPDSQQHQSYWSRSHIVFKIYWNLSKKQNLT